MPISTSRPRVLVVDASYVVRGLLSRILGSQGYDVVTVDGGEAAIAAASQSIDVVLLDVGMPGINGVEVCRRLRADASTENLPIILLTRADDQRDVRDGLIAGADAFLIKPVDIDPLLSAVGWLSQGRPQPPAATS